MVQDLLLPLRVAGHADDEEAVDHGSDEKVERRLHAGIATSGLPRRCVPAHGGAEDDLSPDEATAGRSVQQDGEPGQQFAG